MYALFGIVCPTCKGPRVSEEEREEDKVAPMTSDNDETGYLLLPEQREQRMVSPCDFVISVGSGCLISVRGVIEFRFLWQIR